MRARVLENCRLCGVLQKSNIKLFINNCVFSWLLLKKVLPLYCLRKNQGTKKLLLTFQKLKKMENIKDFLTCEQFCEFFNKQAFSTKFAMAKYYCSYEGDDDEPYDFDDDFFNIFFSSPMEAARATHFGHVNWADEYIRFNAYGNLETMTEVEVEDWCDDLAHCIYDCEEFEEIMEPIMYELKEFAGVTCAE